MPYYKVFVKTNPNRNIILRAKSGIQALKKGSKWLKKSVEELAYEKL